MFLYIFSDYFVQTKPKNAASGLRIPMVFNALNKKIWQKTWLIHKIVVPLHPLFACAMRARAYF